MAESKILSRLKGVKMKMMFTYIQYATDVSLIIAIGLGLYTLWMYTYSKLIVVTSLGGMLVFAIGCILQFYCSNRGIGKSILHVWLGCLLGVVVLSGNTDLEEVSTHETMDIMFIISIVLGCLWNFSSRILRLETYTPKVVSTMEILECFGFMIASFVTGKNAPSMIFLTLALMMNLIAIRFKSFLGLLSYLAFLCVTFTIFFKKIDINMNFYGFACFIIRYSFPTIIDLYFSQLTVIERWEAFLRKSRLLRHVTIIMIFLSILTLGILVGQQSANHKEWFVVVPIFIVFAIVWITFEVIYFISCWKLMRHVTECYTIFFGSQDEHRSIHRIMSSRGIRHFSIISQRLIFLALLTTIIAGAIGWETHTGHSLALFFVILPIQCMTLSLFSELGSNLGGRCTGYGLIAPVTANSSEQVNHRNGTKLLPPSVFENIGARATSSLNAIQKFFSYCMIDTFGCDFSTSGLSVENVESKLKAFFEHRTSDGPRFDTYILYYCGDVYDTGDWALIGNTNLKLDTILEWWVTRNVGYGSRLILIMDTMHSSSWAKEITRFRDGFVALQTIKRTKSKDVESSPSGQVGQFTHDWVHHNLDAVIDEEWHDPQRVMKPLFCLSKYWSDFQFHMPTNDDILYHWDLNFPKFTKPLMKLVNLPVCGGYNLLCCCGSVVRCLRRKRMKWLPPRELDTGHGFKLIRS